MSGDDEVENWVLQAIQTGLMEAKMDQMQRVVVISRCTNRVFGPAQWKVRWCRWWVCPVRCPLKKPCEGEKLRLFLLLAACYLAQRYDNDLNESRCG